MSRGLDKYKGEFVYRLLRPNEDPYNDIVCKNPNCNHDISQHVGEGLKIPTQFISTTASFQAAMDWIDTSHSCRPSQYSDLERRNTIIKISVKYIKDRRPALADSAYNFTDGEVRSQYLVGIQMGYARRYEEIDFGRTIPKEAITDIYVVGKGWIGTNPPVKQTVNTPAPIATPTNNSVISPLSTSTPILSTRLPPSLQLITQSLSTTPSSIVSNISLTNDSSITSQLGAPANLTVAKAPSTFPIAAQEERGVKRRLSSEDPVIPSKFRCYVQVLLMLL